MDSYLGSGRWLTLAQPDASSRDLEVAQHCWNVGGTAQKAGIPFNRPALEQAVEAAAGYPFLVQLIGSHAFRAAAREGSDQIFEHHVTHAVSRARRTMGQNVHDPALKGLSATDKSYLIAMAQDDGPSSTSEVARRMGVDVGYGSVYRQRLIDQGLIHPAGHGYVEFTLPYLADYLTPAADALQALDLEDLT